MRELLDDVVARTPAVSWSVCIREVERTDRLSVEDLAVLVGAVSDNLATNVLLQRVGLERVDALTASLGLRRTALLDRVRDVRGAEHPLRLSVGTAAELSTLMVDLARRRLVSEAVSDSLERWLAAGVDLSMVARPFGLDPLAHAQDDRGVLLRNKTGTDRGVRQAGGARRQRGRPAPLSPPSWS